MNEEQKQLRREFAKKQWEERKKNPKTYSEVCKNMSNADKGHKPSNPFKKGMIPWNKGKSLSKEHKINLGLSCKGKGMGNTNGFKKGESYWLGKKRPYMKDVEGFNRTGMSPWNKDKECPQLSGENHWNWQGGISKNSHHPFFFKQLSKKLRAEFPCLICGTKEDLVVHHCDLDKNNNKTSNMLVLCRGHHSEMHHIILEVYNEI